jgi:pyruvate kinase
MKSLNRIFSALALAAEKHKYQRRSGYKKLPYINHLIKVSRGLLEKGETEEDILLASILHDIIEDTDVSREELEEKYGAKVAQIVTELTDDMSLPYLERKQQQVNNAEALSVEAKKIRIADKASNIRDIFTYPLNWTDEKKAAYLENAQKVVEKLRGVAPPLENWFDKEVAFAQSGKEDEEKKDKREVKIKGMLSLVNEIIEQAQLCEAASQEILDKVHPHYRLSAANLLHYQVLRRYDLRDLQKKLGNMGLSRLAKAQTHVMNSLLVTKSILESLLLGEPLELDQDELSFKVSNNLLKSNVKKLLGKKSEGRRSRIMVTLPSEAAEKYEMVYQLMEGGMNCARINCAHDDAVAWGKMVAHVRRASKELGRKCKIAMDLAGPKIRTGSLEEGPGIRKLRPAKDEYGRINQPLQVWLGPQPKDELAHVPISSEHLSLIPDSGKLYFIDSRSKKRCFRILEKQADGALADLNATAYIETGTLLFPDKKLKEALLPIDQLPPTEVPIILYTGDPLRIDKTSIPGQPAVRDEKGILLEQAHISCTAPQVFEMVKPGERILFDDGKIVGKILEITDEEMQVKILYAAEGGGKLRADKGINFPESALTISGLTDKDRKDLEFVAEYADAVNFSFVNRVEDVRELLERLDQLGARNKLGIILKIETQSAYNNLSDILLEAMQVYPVGVMIARGDLAIETGWKNIGRVQEEILSLCQAAHITDIWATQVLENLAKRGIPSRAEITDAVMSQRADCVMLNKGPYILEALKLLDIILKDMDPYREKNAPLMPILQSLK